MKRVMFIGMLAVASQAVSIAQAQTTAAIDGAFAAMAPGERSALGIAISPGDEPLFGGKMTIRAFEKGFFIAHMQGDKAEVQRIVLQSPSPKAPPLGDILTAYNTQKGKRTYGAGLEGEHIVFGEQYRLHVFDHAIVVWRKQDRAVQAAVFKRSFRPGN